jgi:drug/metabolite transporter (DMT)-like permease
MEEFHYVGEVAALATACFWTISALSFEVATKRIGSDAVNITRMVLAFLFLLPTTLLSRGLALPLDAGSHQWIWLGLSGLLGYTLGDFFLFQAFAQVGSRISMLVMASTPALTGILGFLVFGERIVWTGLLGMALIAAGICIVVLKKQNGSYKLSHPLRGLTFAFGGAIGQASGYILSKYGMVMRGGGNFPVLASSQIRLMSGTVGFVILYFLMGKWQSVGVGLKNRKGMAFTTLGAIAGPFIGVSLSLLAVSRTQAGIASTLSSITPILILPFAALFLSEKIGVRDVFGAVLAVGGVALMFVRS